MDQPKGLSALIGMRNKSFSHAPTALYSAVWRRNPLGVRRGLDGGYVVLFFSNIYFMKPSGFPSCIFNLS